MSDRIRIRKTHGWWLVTAAATVGYFADWDAAVNFAGLLQEKGRRMSWVHLDGLWAYRPDEPGLRCSCGDATLPDLVHSAGGCVETDPRPVEVGE